MGNKVLIITLSTFFLLSTLLLSLRKSTNNIENLNVDMFNAVQAQLISNSAIQLTLNKLRFNKNLRGNFENIPLHGGIYNVSVKGNDSVLIKITSKFMNQTSQLEVLAFWDNIIVPPINSGLGISTSNLNLKLQGNIQISGIDKNPDGTPGTAPSVYGISVENIDDSIRIVQEIPKNVKPNVIGVGTAPSIGVSKLQNDYNEIINMFIQSADIILNSVTYASGTVLGTLENPKITYVVDDENFAGNASGAGILIVYGNMSCSGNFYYQGLVIVYGNTSISATATGNSAIYGSMLIFGPSVNVTATGSAIINYSKKALDNIQQKLKSAKFLVSNWKDW